MKVCNKDNAHWFEVTPTEDAYARAHVVVHLRDQDELGDLSLNDERYSEYREWVMLRRESRGGRR